MNEVNSGNNNIPQIPKPIGDNGFNNNMLNNIPNNPEVNSQTNINSTPVEVNNIIPDNNLNINNGINPSQVSTQSNISSQINMAMQNNGGIVNTQNINNNYKEENSANILNDDELLRAFIGKNYDKITTKKFNFAGFFFTGLYMCYRKMFAYGILTFLLSIIVINISNLPYLIFGVGAVVGCFVNKIYLNYAQKKIISIKAKNQGKSGEELIRICTSKGGTSIGKMFLGFIVQFAVAIILTIPMMLIGLGGDVGKAVLSDYLNRIKSATSNVTIEDAEIDSYYSYSCFESGCTAKVKISEGNYKECSVDSETNDMLAILSDYSEYIKVDIFVKNNKITNYKAYLKSNLEDITNIKTEEELRKKIGLYTTGEHTATFTLKEIGPPGFGMEDDETYVYRNYTFIDSNNIEYEMKYISDETLDLTEEEEYDVTFELKKGTFNYEYIIKSINRR